MKNTGQLNVRSFELCVLKMGSNGWYCGKIIQVVITNFEQGSKLATLIIDDVDYSADYINYLNLSYERNMEKLR